MLFAFIPFKYKVTDSHIYRQSKCRTQYFTDKKTYKNLTYANMEKYIKTQANSKEILEKLRMERERSEIQTNPYRSVLAWFLKEFPDYDSYKEFFNETAA